jgi:molybdenum cofactor cytidylyltransferase
MIALEDTVALLLCGGQSRRFGAQDKLMHPLNGKALCAHAGQMLGSLALAHRLATVRDGATELGALLSTYDFEIISLPAQADQALSLQSGLDAALALNPAAVLVALGDMPFVRADHINALAAAATPSQPAASHGEGWVGPPWIASAEWIRLHRDDLKAAIKDQAVAVAAEPAEFRDIDTQLDLPDPAGPR